MPQEFQVLRCYKCNIFQVHQVKKGDKWQCKMCQEKQSFKKSYGVGTGRECRLHVQKLNTQQAGGREQELENIYEQSILSPYIPTTSAGLQMVQSCSDVKPRINTEITSKWAKFIEDEAEVEIRTEGSNASTEEEERFLENVEVVREMPLRRTKSLAKQSSTKIQDRDMKHRNDSNSKNIGIELASRWNERSESFQRYNDGFEINEVNGYKRSSEKFKHNINHGCTKVVKFDFTVPLPIVASESFTVNNLDKKNVNTYKRAFIEPKISSNSKWFKFVDKNGEDTTHIENGSECDSDDNEYDAGSNLNSDDKENYSDDGNHVLDATNNKSSDNRQMIPDSTQLTKNEKTKAKTLFSLIDDEDLDSLLDF